MGVRTKRTPVPWSVSVSDRMALVGCAVESLTDSKPFARGDGPDPSDAAVGAGLNELSSSLQATVSPRANAIPATHSRPKPRPRFMITPYAASCRRATSAFADADVLVQAAPELGPSADGSRSILGRWRDVGMLEEEARKPGRLLDGLSERELRLRLEVGGECLLDESPLRRVAGAMTAFQSNDATHPADAVLNLTSTSRPSARSPLCTRCLKQAWRRSVA